jgi:sulfotransferase family protein
MLPNLVVIGARKCGTTSLYHYLAAHPEIAMSRQKELRFFVAERNWPRGVDWYRRFFDVDAPVRGEASPCYSEHPIHAGVPARMAALIPDAKLVYLVRDPIDRLVSHWVMDSALGYERRPFAEAVADLDRSRFALYGRYWTQVERYLEHFAAERIHVVDRHELLRRREAVMAGVFAFLGVDPSFTSAGFDAVHNPRYERRLRRPVAVARRRLTAAIGSRRMVAVRRRVPRPLYLAFSEPIEPPEIDPELRGRLVDYYSDDVARLRSFTGQAFASWSL